MQDDDRRCSTLLTVGNNFKTGTELRVEAPLMLPLHYDATVPHWVLSLVMKSSAIDGNE
jgi:hypothetical protein